MLKNMNITCWLLVGALLVGAGQGGAMASEKNRIVNGDFEKDLSGWTLEGAVSIDHGTPLKGTGSLQIGPGKGAVRQQYMIRGLQVVNFSALVKTDSPGMEGMVRAKCYDKRHHLVMDLVQPVDAKDNKEHNTGIYFKTQASTTLLVVSIEKTSPKPGILYADSVVLVDEDRDRMSHSPLCDTDQMMQPIWRFGTAYNETVLLVSEGGKPAFGTLLFKPDQILSVRDYGLMTTYNRDTDYIIDGKRLICTAGSRMPQVKEKEFPTGEYPWLSLLGKHVVVTYTHHDSWDGPVPAYQGKVLPRTIQKLTSHTPLTIVATGDSITLGNGTSEFTEIAPYMPTWGELAVHRLKQLYGYDAIQWVNTALGGMTSDWGLANADSAVAALNPDLALIAFGMNDFWSLSPDAFLKNVQGIMARVRARHRNVEFLLIASMRFDPVYTADPGYRGHLLGYATALQTLEGEGVGFLDMTTLTGALFEAKKPKDFLADPMHPNDYLARWYAQGVVAALASEDRDQASGRSAR